MFGDPYLPPGVTQDMIDRYYERDYEPEEELETRPVHRGYSHNTEPEVCPVCKGKTCEPDCYFNADDIPF